MLFSLGGVDGLQVADLFAGTGALGIEALSRGAASVTFVDNDPQSLQLVRDNLTAVGIPDDPRQGSATLVRADVDSWVATTASRYDLILCDPPYDYDGWDPLVSALPADLAILESAGPVPAPPGWGIIKTKRYGGTIVTVTRPEPVTETELVRETELVEKGAS